MYAIKTFGRRAAFQTLGAGETTPEVVPSCAFTHYLGDRTPSGPENADWFNHGGNTAIGAAVVVGVGWLLGGIVPVIGRPIGALVGAGIAGAATYANYAKWKTDGGTTHQPGACDKP